MTYNGVQSTHSNGNGQGSSLDAYLASFRDSDRRREEFLRDLVRRYEQLCIDHQTLKKDIESEREARRAWQDKAGRFESESTRLAQDVNNNCFALALIDGDGAIFQDALLASGADGGSDAAHKLSTEIKQHIHSVDPTAAQMPLIVQMYTNLEGLGKKLYNCGIVKSNADLYSFTRTFSMSQPLFSIVDVGSGKERADHKIKEMLRVFVENRQCKHIVLGGVSHDNGYLNNLAPLKHDPAISSRISLLESVPSEPGFRTLNFHALSCPSVFRSEHLPNKPSAALQSPVAHPIAPQPLRQHSTTSISGPSTYQNTSSTALQSVEPPHSLRNGTPSSSGASPAPIYRTLSTPLSIDEPTHDTNQTSWATVGKHHGGADKNISIARTPKKERPYVVLNKQQERLDPPLNKGRADFAGLKVRMEELPKYRRLCNNHHLLGRCSNGDYCQYDHSTPLTEGERQALRFRARTLQCREGGGCRDSKCINGHHCSYGKGCGFEKCFFESTHDMDFAPAYKCYEGTTLEQFNGPLAVV